MNESVLVIGGYGSGTMTLANGGSLMNSNPANGLTGIVIASNSGSIGTLNIGTLGGSNTDETILSRTISFASGTVTINFNQIDTATLTSSHGTHDECRYSWR